MIPVFMAQLAKDRRSPVLLIAFLVLSIGLTLLFARGGQGPLQIAIFSEETNAAVIEAKWAALLNAEGSPIRYRITDPARAREQVQSGQAGAAVKLMESDYRIIVFDAQTARGIEQHVRQVFTLALQREAYFDAGTPGAVTDSAARYLADPPLSLARHSLDEEAVRPHNMSVQLMFAFTLFTALFVAGFKVNGVTNDKASGIWNRLILSPVTKSGMYLGYLTYAFIVTYIQIAAALLIFRYGLRYETGEPFGLVLLIAAVYTFAIISLAMLFTGFVSKPEQFYSWYPSTIPLIPLISGVYMMPGTLDLPILNLIADLFPISHAMDAFMNVVNAGAGLRDVALPLSLMLLIGVVYMGIGINLVERRRSG